ncbi:MAG: hypothetical protein H7Z14_18405 [Anaerolineae bacterium]|nr:hypothetical protein [Phycisphaerae bacterium]
MTILQRFAELDQILRGEERQPPREQSGAIRLWPALIALAMFYGLCMGSFAVVSGRAGAWRQMVSAAIKVPAQFALTLLVTFPSLYVFNALVGSRLGIRSLARLLTAAMGVSIALLASFGTIIAFFSFTTDSHPFMVVLNVIAFGVSGILGLSFLLRMLKRVPVRSEGADMQAEACTPAGRSATIVFRIWLIVFALVGAQMSWVLRPFIGGEAEFALFRSRGSNFFEALYHLVMKLIGG